MKILFVAETSSIHAAKWINQLVDTGWEIFIFQSQLNASKVNQEFKVGSFFLPFAEEERRSQTAGTLIPFTFSGRVKFLFASLTQKIFPSMYGRYLAKIILTLKPDIIHSLGLDVNGVNNCKVVLQAKRILGENFNAPWVYSTWGADLDYYAKLSDENYKEVVKVLQECDFQIAECTRDKSLARHMGFRGKFLGLLPGGGGLDRKSIEKYKRDTPPSKRKGILIKGRDWQNGSGDPIGRAMTILNAMKQCYRALAPYEIFIFQASPNVAAEAAAMKKKFGLAISVLPYLSYDALLTIMSDCRLFISMTINDGLPNSLVEAMTLGVFPIHSNLESLQDWVTTNRNAILTPAEDAQVVAQAIVTAIQNDKLVDEAQRLNYDIVNSKLSSEVVKPQVLQIYNSLVTDAL